jgi:hypothetical protein
MKRWKTWMTVGLMTLSLGFLTASDVECEDGEVDFNWPDISYGHDYHDDGGYVYYESGCGGWWDCWF